MTTDELPSFWPIARLDDLRRRADADRIAYRDCGNWLNGMVKVMRAKDRRGVEKICKAGGPWHALVKCTVERSMFTNANVERVHP